MHATVFYFSRNKDKGSIPTKSVNKLLCLTVQSALVSFLRTCTGCATHPLNCLDRSTTMFSKPSLAHTNGKPLFLQLDKARQQWRVFNMVIPRSEVSQPRPISGDPHGCATYTKELIKLSSVTKEQYCLTPFLSSPSPYLPPQLTLPGLPHFPPQLTLPELPSVPPRLTLLEHPSVPPRLKLPEHPSVPPRLTLPEHSRRPFSYPYPHVSDHDVTVIVTSTKQQRGHKALVMFSGMRMALLETKVAVVALLSKYELSASKKTSLPIRLDPRTVTLSVEGDIWLRISNRK
ncbi:unnamed protein product [Timema podura]|uniref:Uncharacterized protein n=1 Tax=Timema podura TaxID=61482 RepID=A0ABN7NUG3_TIMPD|nr:unnamed protein product [Timema podura]